MAEQLSSEEEGYLFHALGYEQWPNWHSKRKEDRNNFYGGKDDPIIRNLVEAGYMTPFQKGWVEENEYYGVTDKGIKYVEEQFDLRKKQAKKPTRSQRRYSAYLDVSDWFNNFHHFLRWLSSKPEDFGEEKEMNVRFRNDVKARWNI